MEKNRISFSELGKFVRFGNQIFQYAASKKIAKMYDCELEVPQEWIGRKIWEIPEKPLQEPFLPKYRFNSFGLHCVNHDLWGNYQYQNIIGKISKKELKEWFVLKKEWKDKFPKNEYYAAAHVRRGDYVDKWSNIFCVISENSYLKACDKFNINKNELAWVRENEPTIDKDIPEDISFLPDFMKLLNSSILLRANSTFSWWAATLGDAKVYSPLVEDKIGYQDVEFVCGNYPRMVDSKNCGDTVTDLYLKKINLPLKLLKRK